MRVGELQGFARTRPPPAELRGEQQRQAGQELRANCTPNRSKRPQPGRVIVSPPQGLLHSVLRVPLDQVTDVEALQGEATRAVIAASSYSTAFCPPFCLFSVITTVARARVYGTDRTEIRAFFFFPVFWVLFLRKWAGRGAGGGTGLHSVDCQSSSRFCCSHGQ